MHVGVQLRYAELIDVSSPHNDFLTPLHVLVLSAWQARAAAVRIGSRCALLAARATVQRSHRQRDGATGIGGGPGCQVATQVVCADS